jgi:hypothetical protein
MTSATVIEHLQEKDTGDRTTLYFFCDHRDPAKLRVQDLLHTLIKQLVGRNVVCLERTKSFRDARKSGTIAKPLTVDEQTEMVKSLCSLWTSAFLVVDALDECEGLESVVSTLSKLMKGSNVQVLVTSRYSFDLVRDVSRISQCRSPSRNIWEMTLNSSSSPRSAGRSPMGLSR